MSEAPLGLHFVFTGRSLPLNLLRRVRKNIPLWELPFPAAVRYGGEWSVLECEIIGSARRALYLTTPEEKLDPVEQAVLADLRAQGTYEWVRVVEPTRAPWIQAPLSLGWLRVWTGQEGIEAVVCDLQRPFEAPGTETKMGAPSPLSSDQVDMTEDEAQAFDGVFAHSRCLAPAGMWPLLQSDYLRNVAPVEAEPLARWRYWPLYLREQARAGKMRAEWVDLAQFEWACFEARYLLIETREARLSTAEAGAGAGLLSLNPTLQVLRLQNDVRAWLASGSAVQAPQILFVHRPHQTPGSAQDGLVEAELSPLSPPRPDQGLAVRVGEWGTAAVVDELQDSGPVPMTVLIETLSAKFPLPDTQRASEVWRQRLEELIADAFCVMKSE